MREVDLSTPSISSILEFTYLVFGERDLYIISPSLSHSVIFALCLFNCFISFFVVIAYYYFGMLYFLGMF